MSLSNTMAAVIRVLLLIPTLDQSGAEKQLALLATHLPRPEFDVRVVALTRGGPYSRELEAAGIPLTVLGKRFKFDPVAYWKLKNLLRNSPPDILHTWLFAANAYGRFAAGATPRYRVVVSERCVDVWKAGWQHRIDRYLAGRTTRLVANSQSVAGFYAERGFPPQRLVVIPNGVSPAVSAGEWRAEVRRELGIDPTDRVVTFVGRLAPQKRLRDLIWAFELIRAKQDDMIFLLIGDGPEQDQLKRFADSLLLGNQVRFLGYRADAARLVSASDVFWIASDFEGQSNSVMEAMAAGLPVVASDIPPNRELVVHGTTGFLVPTGDRIAFSQFAEKLLLDLPLARQMGAAGRELMAAEFGVEKMVASYARLYRELMS